MLQMDGIDDILYIPNITFTRIEVDGSLEKRAWASIIMVDATTGADKEWYITENSVGDTTEGGISRFIDGNSGKAITSNQRHLFSITSSSAVVGRIDIFCSSVYGDSQKGEVYSVKVWNGETLVCDIDFTTGSGNDRTSNGNNATIIGGTFVGVPPVEQTDTTPPTVTIKSVSKTKISDEVGMNESVIVFSLNEDVTEWIVRVNGVDHTTGTIADSGGSVLANTEITARISHDELNSEGNNRVNFYGKDLAGNWTLYGS